MSSRRTPQWARQPRPPRRPGRNQPPPARSGWRPQEWSVKRGLAVGLSSSFALLLLVGIFGNNPKDHKTASASASAKQAAAATATTTPPPTSASPSPSPSPTRTTTVLPDLTGTDLQSAQDRARALGYRRFTSHDLTGQGRHPVTADHWHVCAQRPGPSTSTADPAATAVTFDVVKNGESCALRVHATPSPTPTRTHTPTRAPTHAPTHRPAATCAPHTVGTCAAGSPHPAGTTAECNDGTYSYSAHFRGTCSRHGGVRYWYW